ncbi:MAG: FkbM family methyltransferase [Flavobacteriaceae bacterium]|nr:FkbM family methyltransferase [Flavobacteriaceae bacterium]
MGKAKSKLNRYQNLIKRVLNWKFYILKKVVGFNEDFEFNIRNFGKILVLKNMLGPFRENFLDDIYFKHIPKSVFNTNQNPVIIDIGANVGFFSLAAFSKYPKAKIYAFEPHPYCFKVLKNYKQEFKRFDWNIFNQAVSNKNENIFLNTNNLEGFTTVTSVFKKSKDIKVFAVKAVSFDTFLEENKIDYIDFIKLDCEGSEYEILYALPKEKFKIIKSLCIETHKGENENQNLNSLNKYLKNVGYKTEILDEGNYSGYIWAWKSKNEK